MDALIYDIEIKKAICSSHEKRIAGIEYCEGWRDFSNMGISVIGAYDYVTGRYRVFCEDNFEDFLKLTRDRSPLVGFNNIPFDNMAITATLYAGLPEEFCYDLLREIWAAAGNGPEFDVTTHAGYGLDAVCAKNFGTRKTGNGAHAPVLWQRGQIGAVIDYCLNDVTITKQVFDKVLETGELISPKDGSVLKLRMPS